MNRVMLLAVLLLVLLPGSTVGAQGEGDFADTLVPIPACVEEDLAIVMEAVDLISYDIGDVSTYASEGDIDNALRAAEAMVGNWRVLRKGLPNCTLAVHTDRMMSDLAYTANLMLAYTKLRDADASTYQEYFMGHAQELQDFGAWLLLPAEG